jgi:hypothetical protein
VRTPARPRRTTAAPTRGPDRLRYEPFACANAPEACCQASMPDRGSLANRAQHAYPLLREPPWSTR